MTTPLASSAPATGTPAPAADAKLRKAAQAFEAVFLRQILGAARSSSLGDGLFESDQTDQFRELQDAKTADTMAQSGALHIADLLVQKLGARVTAPGPAK